MYWFGICDIHVSISINKRWYLSILCQNLKESKAEQEATQRLPCVLGFKCPPFAQLLLLKLKLSRKWSEMGSFSYKVYDRVKDLNSVQDSSIGHLKMYWTWHQYLCSLDQLEASIQVTWLLSTIQRPSLQCSEVVAQLNFKLTLGRVWRQGDTSWLKVAKTPLNLTETNGGALSKRRSKKVYILIQTCYKWPEQNFYWKPWNCEICREDFCIKFQFSSQCQYQFNYSWKVST